MRGNASLLLVDGVETMGRCETDNTGGGRGQSSVAARRRRLDLLLHCPRTHTTLSEPRISACLGRPIGGKRWFWFAGESDREVENTRTASSRARQRSGHVNSQKRVSKEHVRCRCWRSSDEEVPEDVGNFVVADPMKCRRRSRTSHGEPRNHSWSGTHFGTTNTPTPWHTAVSSSALRTAA